jgi:hypothetical protein
MNTSHQLFQTADETRLSMLFRNTADLGIQLYELNKLRYRVRQAQRSARKSLADKPSSRKNGLKKTIPRA